MFILRWTAAALITAFFGMLSLILSFMPPKGWSIRFFGGLWARAMMRAWGVRVTASPRLERGRSRIIMPNHQSFVDILVIFATVPDRITFLAKKSLFRLPFLGWAMKGGGFIPVDRADRSTARETFKRAKEALEEGRSILIFPEETRSEDGKLLPLKKGGFLLAHATGFPILPMGIWGTGAILSKNAKTIKGGRVRVRFGGEILYDKSKPLQACMDTVRNSILACVDAARTDAEGPSSNP